MREATPAAINVVGSATGASESTMACDTGLVEPAPLRQVTIKNLIFSITSATHANPCTRTRVLIPGGGFLHNPTYAEEHF